MNIEGIVGPVSDEINNEHIINASKYPKHHLMGISPIGRKRATEMLLKWFGVESEFIGEENWKRLEDDMLADGVAPTLHGLTHEDYIDVAVLYETLPRWAKFTPAVLSDGFYKGWGLLRGLVAWNFVRTIPVSRSNAAQSLNEDVPQMHGKLLERGRVGVWFWSGNRRVDSSLSSHGAELATMNGAVSYPFVFLTNGSPVFASKSGVKENLKTLITGGNNEAMTYYFLLMPPLNDEMVKKMSENYEGSGARSKITGKFEVVRVLALKKLLREQPELIDANEKVVEWLRKVPNHLGKRTEKAWDDNLEWLQSNLVSDESNMSYLDYLGVE